LTCSARAAARAGRLIYESLTAIPSPRSPHSCSGCGALAVQSRRRCRESSVCTRSRLRRRPRRRICDRGEGWCVCVLERDAERRLRLGAERRRRPGARITTDSTTTPVAISLPPTTNRGARRLRPRGAFTRGRKHHEPTCFDDNSTALFRRCICRGLTTVGGLGSKSRS
jgi:hypothetical protein